VRHAREALQEGSLQPDLVQSLRLYCGREVGSRNAAELVPKLSEQACASQGAIDSALSARMQRRLNALLHAKRIVGAQVVVVEGGRLVADLVAGSLSTIDARPVRSCTRFPLLGATGGVAALALLRSLRRSADVAGNPLEVRPVSDALSIPVACIWPEFGGGGSAVRLKDLLSHAAGLQDAFPGGFSAGHLDDVDAMISHLEQVNLKSVCESRCAYLLQAFALTKLGDSVAGKDSLLHWLGDELGPLGLDIAGPRGCGDEASICRDLLALARVSMTEIEAGRERRQSQNTEGAAQSSEDGPAATTLLAALGRDPLGFDPLQGNTRHGGLFRGGLSLGVSARSLATLLSNPTLHEELSALHALETCGADSTALGWMLTGGATHWTAGGLQALQLRGCSRGSCLSGETQSGYGVVCGLGPCVVNFPSLGQGGVTIAVMVNDVLHGRAAAAELLAEALVGFGYKPAWTSMPVRIMADAVRMARGHELEPLVKSMGGLPALRANLELWTRETNSEAALPANSSRCGCCIACAFACSSSGEKAGVNLFSRGLRVLGGWCATGCIRARPASIG